MISYGESSVIVDNTNVGTLRLRDLSTRFSLAPSIGLELGLTLYDQKSEAGSRVQLECVEAHGWLKLGENGRMIAPFAWRSVNHVIVSSDYGYEGQISGSCELDFYRIEKIEEFRKGGPLSLGVECRLDLRRDGVSTAGRVDTIRAIIPHERWVEVLAGLRSEDYEILELRYPRSDLQEYRNVTGALRQARMYVDRGDYQAALVQCRRGMEMLAVAVRKSDTGKSDGVADTLTAFVGNERAKQYATVLGSVKRLGNIELHQVVDFGLSRSEALFAIRTAEALVHMIADIQREPRVVPKSLST